MTHQVLEENNSTNHEWHKQGDTELLQLLNNYLLIVSFEYGENCLDGDWRNG